MLDSITSSINDVYLSNTCVGGKAFFKLNIKLKAFENMIWQVFKYGLFLF